MVEKIAKVGVRKKEGYLYYIDKRGDISRAKMARGGKKCGRVVKVARVGVKKDPGYLYYLDKQGDISRAKKARKARRVL